MGAFLLDQGRWQRERNARWEQLRVPAMVGGGRSTGPTILETVSADGRRVHAVPYVVLQ